MAGKRGRGRGRKGDNFGRDAEEIPSADEIRQRFDKVFPALPQNLQDAYVRLVETSLRTLRERR